MFKAITAETKLQGEHYESLMRYLRSNVPKNAYGHQYLNAAMLYPPIATQYYVKSLFSNNHYFYWDQQEMPTLEMLGHPSIIYLDSETHHRTIVFSYQSHRGKNTISQNGTVIDDSDNPKVWVQTDYLIMMRMRAIWKAMDLSAHPKPIGESVIPNVSNFKRTRLSRITEMLHGKYWKTTQHPWGVETTPEPWLAWDILANHNDTRHRLFHRHMVNTVQAYRFMAERIELHQESPLNKIHNQRDHFGRFYGLVAPPKPRVATIADYWLNNK